MGHHERHPGRQHARRAALQPAHPRERCDGCGHVPVTRPPSRRPHPWGDPHHHGDTAHPVDHPDTRDVPLLPHSHTPPHDTTTTTSLWSTYSPLILPATLDCVGTLSTTYGLAYIPASVYLVIRGGNLVFVPLLNYGASRVWGGPSPSRHQVYGAAFALCAVGSVSVSSFIAAHNGVSTASHGTFPTHTVVVAVVAVVGGTLALSVENVVESRLVGSGVGHVSNPVVVTGVDGGHPHHYTIRTPHNSPIHTRYTHVKPVATGPTSSPATPPWL